jgi:hypothetical protein
MYLENIGGETVEAVFATTLRELAPAGLPRESD